MADAAELPDMPGLPDGREGLGLDGPSSADVGVPISLHQDAARPAPTRAGGYLRRSRAVRLVEQFLRTDILSAAQLADALVVTTAELETYRTGAVRMPLERQLCLALLAIERAPALARHGHALRDQVRAELAFQSRETETHMIAPPRLWR